jgi:squalene-hopene/tetraprenyl-beta-curcumene cyclase
LTVTPDRLESAYQTALSALLAERTPEGHWVGELSTSALSTATAVMALSLVAKGASNSSHRDLIANGIRWLVDHQNADGGWGDTTKSLSNISTSMLCRAAFPITGTAEKYAPSIEVLDAYLDRHCGTAPAERAEAIRRRYGKDHTFAVPILTTCAIAGLVDWREVTPLPFELACLPQSLFRFLRLPVVSYALPALIAIGQAVYYHRPPRNPVIRLIRHLARRKSLRVLQSIQPSNGGFLEATPLTSFVTLSLASIGLGEHLVAKKGVEFIVNSVRADGSWPIDTNLATWVTTLAINALATAGELKQATSPAQSASEGNGKPSLAVQADGKKNVTVNDLSKARAWLLKQQFKERHPYTGAAPGGWGWTPLPGSVPDCDDTPGALVTLWQLGNGLAFDCLQRGSCWLLDLQNSDGGWPTFCRGWTNLAFDRSGPDLTAHALRALHGWLRPGAGKMIHEEQLWRESWNEVPFGPQEQSPRRMLGRVSRSIQRGIRYLRESQGQDGSWLPLWFGNQHAPDDENPTYGTARVLAAYRDLDIMNTEPARRGVAWLLSVQNADGGWGGAKDVPSSVEETALAVEILLDAGLDADSAVNRGLAWLVEQVEKGGLWNPTPIGFYFAKLWYFEKLYPMIFTVAALGRARRKLSGCRAAQRNSEE